MYKHIFFFLLFSLSSSFSNIPIEMGEGNLRRLEKDLGVLQQFVYKRFGGDPAYHDAGINPPEDPSQTMLLEKIEALNKRLSDLTNKTEELQHKMQVQENIYERERKDFHTKISELEMRLTETNEALKKEEDLSYQEKLEKMTADELILHIQTSGNLLPKNQFEKILRFFAEKFSEDSHISLVYKELLHLMYGKENYKEAALYAGEFYKKSPDDKDAPDVLLMMAFSLNRLEKSKEACTTLSKIESDYPNTEDSFKEKLVQARTLFACPA